MEIGTGVYGGALPSLQLLSRQSSDPRGFSLWPGAPAVWDLRAGHWGLREKVHSAGYFLDGSSLGCLELGQKARIHQWQVLGTRVSKGTEPQEVGFKHGWL